MLEAAIPAGHRLGASLEAFVLNRAGSYWLAGSSGQSARWVDRAQRYRSGAPDQDLTAQQLRILAEILLSGTPGQAETEAAMALLTEADDDQLSVMLDGRGLLDLLDAAAEVTPGLEERVNEFLGRWFAGGGRPQGQPAAAFSPALLDPSLPDDAVTGQLDDELAQRVADVLARRSDAQVRAALARAAARRSSGAGSGSSGQRGRGRDGPARWTGISAAIRRPSSPRHSSVTSLSGCSPAGPPRRSGRPRCGCSMPPATMTSARSSPAAVACLRCWRRASRPAMICAARLTGSFRSASAAAGRCWLRAAWCRCRITRRACSPRS